MRGLDHELSSEDPFIIGCHNATAAGGYPFAMMVFTNHPHHYAQANELDPRRHLLSVMGSSSPSPAVVAIHRAADLYGNIPNFFPS